MKNLNKQSLRPSKTKKEKSLVIKLPELDIKSIVLIRDAMNTFLFDLDEYYFEELFEYYNSVHLGREEPY